MMRTTRILGYVVSLLLVGIVAYNMGAGTLVPDLPRTLTTSLATTLQGLSSGRSVIVPENITDAFYASGWEVVVTNNDLAETYFPDREAGSVTGATVPSEQRIYLSSETPVIERTHAHEIGHWIDLQCGWLSRTEEFSGIVEREANVFYEQVMTYTQMPAEMATYEETFAEAFLAHVDRPATLAKSCPELFAFVQNAVENALLAQNAEN